MANGPEFFQTIMGRAFYEGTMPRLVKQLERLNENLERLVEAQSKPKEEVEARPDSNEDWVLLCKRTEDPKLAWLERTLSAHGILSRRNGHSFHAPVLEVPKGHAAAANAILNLVDEIEDDQPVFHIGGDYSEGER